MVTRGDERRHQCSETATVNVHNPSEIQDDVLSFPQHAEKYSSQVVRFLAKGKPTTTMNNCDALNSVDL